MSDLDVATDARQEFRGRGEHASSTDEGRGHHWHGHGNDHGSGGDDTNVVLDWVATTGEVIRQHLDDNRPIAGMLGAVESLAVFDVVNAINDRPGYLVDLDAPDGISLEAAIAGAAFQVLSQAYPDEAAELRDALFASLREISDSPTAERDGVRFGMQIADAVLAMRADDLIPSDSEDYGVREIGKWRATPPDFRPAVEPQHGEVQPFVLESGDQFRPPPPPDLPSAEYAAALNQVKELGEDSSDTRTAEQTEIAIFWSNDEDTYTPGGHLNAIAVDVAEDAGISVEESAFLFAELNAGLADALIACWDAKYTYDFWRPITAVRQADRDGNPDTDGQRGWTPLLETPNHPEYPSGHASIGASFAAIMTDFFGEDYAFSATSAALPGVVRHFDSFEEAGLEDAMSRIYGGVHFKFSMDIGLLMGGQVGDATIDAFSAWRPTSTGDVLMA